MVRSGAYPRGSCLFGFFITDEEKSFITLTTSVKVI
jgi:hypothetical protein